MTISPASLSGSPRNDAKRPNLVWRYLSRFDDGEVVRWAFRGLLVGTVGVLALDAQDLSQKNGWFSPPTEGRSITVEPILPPAVQLDGPSAPTADPRPFVTTGSDDLSRPMTFTLLPGGVLKAEGTIEAGTAKRFHDEIEARGEYVRTVSLNSPGGALDEAMEMAVLVRQKGLGTEVADGALCASSCPLLFAGGRERRAGARAAVGLHQFYAATRVEAGPAQVMADAQATTARISRHLSAMGVDSALWLHALDTPPRSLYYLSPGELSDYRLVTTPQSLAAAGVSG